MQAVTFDMDGLMFNTEDVYTLVGSELLARRGHTFTPELKDAMMGLPPRAAFEVVIAGTVSRNRGTCWRRKATRYFSVSCRGGWRPCRG